MGEAEGAEGEETQPFGFRSIQGFEVEEAGMQYHFRATVYPFPKRARTSYKPRMVFIGAYADCDFLIGTVRGSQSACRYQEIGEVFVMETHPLSREAWSGCRTLSS